MPSKLLPSATRKIEDECQRRGITALYHFTPLKNLDGIFAHGLLSNAALDAGNLEYIWTDEYRYDLQPEAVSLSITDINRSMFKGKQIEVQRRWAILEIEPSVLWTHSCRFCWANAASDLITRSGDDPEKLSAFFRIFEDQPVSRRDPRMIREIDNVPDNMPTYNDAEVQVLEKITPHLFRNVTVKDSVSLPVAQVAMRKAGFDLPVKINRRPFLR